MTLRVLTFRPGIKSMRRSFAIRAIDWQGQLWLSAKDAGQAIGWHPDTFRHRRQDALPGDAWGYATMPTGQGEHMMAVVSIGALSEMLRGARGRQAWAFRRWLGTILAASVPAAKLESPYKAASAEHFSQPHVPPH